MNNMNIYTESPDLDTIGGRLSRARDAVGLTPAQLARRLGVKSSTIQGWESDRALPRANRLAMLAGLLAVSPSWLLHGVGSAPVEDGSSPALRPLIAQLERLKRLQNGDRADHRPDGRRPGADATGGLNFDTPRDNATFIG